MPALLTSLVRGMIDDLPDKIPDMADERMINIDGKAVFVDADINAVG